MADGGLLVSVRYVDTTQILPLIRYWIPHIHVVDPKSLQDELMQGLKVYCF
jgi:predicted DNA-binding transcriptional regulator YafY